MIADTEPMTINDLRVVALRLQGLGPATVATKAERKITSARIDYLCLAAAVRYTHDDAGPGWRVRPAGRAAEKLVAHGLPPKRSMPPTLQDNFNRLWRAGMPLDHVRTELSLNKPMLKRLVENAPRRWVGRDVAAHLGWSRENHRLRLARGHFPQPDGKDRRSDWWWPETVRTWAEAKALTRCPVCGAQVERLQQHSRRHAVTRYR
jgi:hypothetical protein